jgi:hypothetical protein
MELILHRGGNRPGAVPADASADMIEADVHLFRGRLEVRHEKVLWPSTRLWDRWYVLPRLTPRRTLDDLLGSDATGPLLLDLKGVSPKLARAVVRAIDDRRPVTIASKSWWLLMPFRSVAGVRTFRSVGNRFELAVLRHLPTRCRPDGIVAHHRLLTATTVGELHHRAPAVWAWGARDRAEADRLGSWGVDGLIVDDLELLRELRFERDAGLDAGA